MGEQNNGFLQCITITEWFKWASHDGGNIRDMLHTRSFCVDGGKRLKQRNKRGETATEEVYRQTQRKVRLPELIVWEVGLIFFILEVALNSIQTANCEEMAVILCTSSSLTLHLAAGRKHCCNHQVTFHVSKKEVLANTRLGLLAVSLLHRMHLANWPASVRWITLPWWTNAPSTLPEL